MVHFPVSARRVVGTTLAALLLGAVLSVSSPQIALAAPGSFTVDDPNDAVDANVGDGICATAMTTCSVRAAVQEANARGGSSDITFASSADSSILTLTGSGGAEVGDLEIASGVTVRMIGNIPAPDAVTTITADPMGDRHVHVLAGGRLELQMVSLVGGATAGDGGAILNEGQVLVTNTPTHTGSYVAFANNSASGLGGAVANLAGAQLTISDVSTAGSYSRIDVTSNLATGGGGAISNAGGTVDLQGSTTNASHDVYVDNNSTSSNGGGITNTSGGSVLLGCRSYVRFSNASLGGNVHNEKGQLTLVGSGIDGGSATDGGGLYNSDSGQVTVAGDATCQNDAQISRSFATNSGGALANRGSINIKPDARLDITSGAKVISDASVGGGVWNESGSLDVAGRLTISGTSAALAGGGLAVTGGKVTTNSGGQILVSDARVGGNGGGIAVTGGTLAASVVVRSSNAVVSGGGVYVVKPGAATLTNSAIVQNSADQAGGLAAVSATVDAVNTTIAGNSSSGSGGGVLVDGGTTTLRHVSVVDNTPDGVWSNTNPMLRRVLMARNAGKNCSGATASSGDLNVYDDATCSPTGNDLTDTSRFADVADRLEGDVFDGTTTSYALSPGNPAIDWVTDKGCGDPADDQNGAPRPVDGDGDGVAHCDAGAIEADVSGALWSISGKVVDEATHLPLEGVCVYAVDPGGSGDGNLVVTGADGTYTSEVPDGHFLMAFFVPLAAAGDKGCGDSGFDLRYQPEWYRNLAIEFGADDSDPDVIFPDLADVTLVEVDGEHVTGIDVCLGAGPGAGLDAPCEPEVPAGPDETVTLSPAAPPGSAGTQAAGTRTGASSTRPSALAFTGVSLLALWWGVALLAAGIGLVGSTRRRRDQLTATAVAGTAPGGASFR